MKICSIACLLAALMALGAPAGTAAAEDRPDLSGNTAAAPERDVSSSPEASDTVDSVEVAGVTVAGTALPDESAVSPIAAPLTVPDLIVDAAGRYGLSSERMLRVAWCESRWDPAARGPGGAAGVFQFVPNTWSWASVGAGVGGQSAFDAAANVEAAAWLMATDGFHHWGCR